MTDDGPGETDVHVGPPGGNVQPSWSVTETGWPVKVTVYSPATGPLRSYVIAAPKPSISRGFTCVWIVTLNVWPSAALRSPPPTGWIIHWTVLAPAPGIL